MEEFDDDQPAPLTNRASMCVGEIEIGAAVGARRRGQWPDGEQSLAQLQLVLTDSIGEETELADAHHSGGQYVQQKAANELDRVQRHGLGAAAVRVVFPVEADAAIFQGPQAVV